MQGSRNLKKKLGSKEKIDQVLAIICDTSELIV